MKRGVVAMLCVALCMGIVSCAYKIELGDMVLSFTTLGFKDGTTRTNAVWGDGESVSMYRSEDWSMAIMQQCTGGGGATARFGGVSADTRDGYYAVRPAEAVGAISNGKVTLTVQPTNIFTSNDNTSIVVPQVGKGVEKLSFTSIFGALKFSVEELSQISLAKAIVPNKERGLHGTILYNLSRGSSTDEDVEYDATRRASSPLDISADNAIYVALPAGTYSEVVLLVRNDSNGEQIQYTATDVNITRNNVTAVAVQPTTLSCVVGSWRIKSFCGQDADADLYIDFKYNGEFVIMQRTSSYIYVQYGGTYTVDGSNRTISGEYSDGVEWATSYKYSVDEDMNLVLESVGEKSEITIYESADMPSGVESQSSIKTNMIDRRAL